VDKEKITELTNTIVTYLQVSPLAQNLSLIEVLTALNIAAVVYMRRSERGSKDDGEKGG